LPSKCSLGGTGRGEQEKRNPGLGKKGGGSKREVQVMVEVRIIYCAWVYFVWVKERQLHSEVSGGKERKILQYRL